MRTKGQTSIHLLLASIVTLFGVMLILITLAMSWEAWMVPIIVIGNSLVWILHIGRVGSETFYENLCAGLLMIGFFFFGVHDIVLYDIPAVACMLLLIFSMFNKKINDLDYVVSVNDTIDNKLIIIKKGKKNYYLGMVS